MDEEQEFADVVGTERVDSSDPAYHAFTIIGPEFQLGQEGLAGVLCSFCNRQYTPEASRLVCPEREQKREEVLSKLLESGESAVGFAIAGSIAALFRDGGTELSQQDLNWIEAMVKVAIGAGRVRTYSDIGALKAQFIRGLDRMILTGSDQYPELEI